MRSTSFVGDASRVTSNARASARAPLPDGRFLRVVMQGDESQSNRRRGGEDSRRRQPWHGKGRGGYDKKERRRGRPAWQRSPDDTPLRDGNRDRFVGLLTERAAKTLGYYLSETNLHAYHWLNNYLREHQIPRDGAWDDVSGETFLRGLLGMSPEEAKFDVGQGWDEMYNNFSSLTVDPRQIAQRIMDIRVQLAKELAQDLSTVADENAELLREALAASLSLEAAHPLDAELRAGGGGGGGGEDVPADGAAQ